MQVFFVVLASNYENCSMKILNHEIILAENTDYLVLVLLHLVPSKQYA